MKLPARFLLGGIVAAILASPLWGYAEFYFKVVDASERPLTGATFTWKPGGGSDFGPTRGAFGFSVDNLATGSGDTFYTLSDAAPNVSWSVSVRNNQANWKVWLEGARPYWGTIKVARTGFVPKEVRINASDGYVYWRRIELRTLPTLSNGGEIDREDYVSPGTVPATVTDPRGNPIAGALVKITNEWGTLYTATTNASGGATVTLRDPGRWTATAEKAGYTSNTRTGANYPGDSNGVALTLTSTATAPSITTQPSGATVFAGASVSFSVVAGGSAPLAYQWRKDGAAIAGATVSAYAIGSVRSADFGSYSVVVSNAAGSVTSTSAQLLAGQSPSITAWTGGATVNAGGGITFSVTVGGTAPFTYQWSKNGTAIPGATSSSYRISSVQLSDAGNYAVVVTNPGGSGTHPPATLVVNSPSTGGASGSAGGASGAGSAGGSSGSGSSGGSSAGSGSTGGSSAGSGGTGGSGAGSGGGASSGGSTPGSSAKPVGGVFGGAPIAGTQKLINISTRGFVSGAVSLAAGFVSSGSGRKQFLVRAIGPGLAAFGVTGVCADPDVTIYDSAGREVVRVDDWGGAAELASASTRAGAFPLTSGSRDAVLVYALAPGLYTAEVRGVAGASGIALIEIYELQ